MTPLLETIIKHVSAPQVDLRLFAVAVSSLSYSSYVGVIGIGRIARGRVKSNSQVVVVDREGKKRNARILQIFGFHGLARIEVPKHRPATSLHSPASKAWASPIPCAIRPMSSPAAAVRGRTDREYDLPGQQLAIRRQGRQVRHSRQIRERLQRELIHNVRCASKTPPIRTNSKYPAAANCICPPHREHAPRRL